MSRFSKVVTVGIGLLIVSIVVLKNQFSNGAPPTPTIEKATAGPKTAASNHKTYSLADLPAITIFGNDRTGDRLRALAAIKTASANQVKGLIEGRGGSWLDLHVFDGDRAKRLRLKATDQTQVTLDGRTVKMMELKPLLPVLATTTPDRSTALKVEAQSLPQADNEKTREIVAMTAADPKANRLYVVEAAAGLRGDRNGEHLLWTLASSGEVIRKQLLSKKNDSYNTPPGTFVMAMPGSQDEAIVIGPFGKLSGIHQQRLFHADSQGVTAAELEGIWSCNGGVLAANGKEILAVGDNVGINRIYGMLWKLNLNGNILSKTSYERRTLESFCDIVLTDDQGGFIIAEDSPKAINKFGLSEGSAWLLRCDRDGKVLTETSFPGRRPQIRAMGNGRFAVLYQTLSPGASDWQLRVVNLQLNELWEKKLGWAGMGVNPPAFCLAMDDSLVTVVGAGFPPPRKKSEQLSPGVEITQWDRDGRKLFSASLPAVSFLVGQEIHAAYVANCVYVAVRTSGMLFSDGVESCIYRIPLSASH